MPIRNAIRILVLAVAAVSFAPMQALAAQSCASFAIVESYDAEVETVKLDFVRGNTRRFFPKPEGAPNVSKLPRKCSGKVRRQDSFPVQPTGGRLTITQVRSNLEGKMLNDTRDSEWLGRHLQKLIENKTEVAVVIRPGLGKDAPLGVTTIYMPITPEEEKEIERLNAQAEDVD